MSKLNKKDFSTQDVVTPKNGVYKVYVNYYWWCEDGDPKKAIIFKGFAPQCNSDRRILEGSNPPYTGCEIVKIPVAYREWEVKY